MGKSLNGKELGQGIYQQPNGTYCARVADRFGRRLSKRSKKLQEVRQWRADMIYANEHGDLECGGDMLVDTWYEYWISMKKKTVRPNTARNYEERYRHNIQGVIGNKILSQVKPIHCQQVFTNMAEKGYKSSSMYQARITLFNMFEFAKENEYIQTNPCKKSVKSDIGKPSEKRMALSIAEQRAFLLGCGGNSYENQFRFVLQTGLRTGELVGLKWSDIDFKKKTLTIERALEYRHSAGEWREGPPKSKSGYRTIPLTDEAIRILKEQKRKNSKLRVVEMEWSDRVFLCRAGTPIKNSTYDTALYKICDKTGVRRFSMHVLRHTFATRCIEAGMIPKTLQEILGHSNIGITMNIYAHITEEEKSKEMELVARALNVI